MSKEMHAKELFEAARPFVLYEKDPETRIATLTLNRPDRMNAILTGMRALYADYVFKANIDDDVKVLIVRGNGDDLGTGADIREMQNQFGVNDVSLAYEFGIENDAVTYPPVNSFRFLPDGRLFFYCAIGHAAASGVQED